MKSKVIPFYNPSEKWVVKSKDCSLYDADGKEYIDFESGVWSTNIGHSHDNIVRLMESQIRESIHNGYKFQTKQAEALSGELLEITGLKNGASVFLCSGSETVNLAISLSQHVTGRKKILKIDNSFLSSYGYGKISADNEYIVNVRYNDFESINGINFNEICAFVVETGGASIEMVKFPGSSFIDKLTKLSKENHCMVIAEEVTTGMGRMGKWFGFQYYDFIPDMVVIAKGLGNGYPVSALTINDKVLDYLEQNPLRYVQSHQNDPLGCAIGLEVIKTIKENDLLTQCMEMGKYFRDQLNLIRDKHPTKIKEIRARGLMLALEFSNEVDGAYVHDRLFENGLVVGYKLNVLRFLPPLTIKRTHIDKLMGELDKLLSE
jgi:acetylornithine/N-succinyldiaminopimelate aminotransferase